MCTPGPHGCIRWPRASEVRKTDDRHAADPLGEIYIISKRKRWITAAHQIDAVGNQRRHVIIDKVKCISSLGRAWSVITEIINGAAVANGKCIFNAPKIVIGLERGGGRLCKSAWLCAAERRKITIFIHKTWTRRVGETGGRERASAATCGGAKNSTIIAVTRI